MTQIKPTTVLLIEDDSVDAMLFGRLLETTPNSYHLRVATTLQEGLHQIISFQPDVVVLDLCLPDGEGLGNLKQVQKADPRVPVVILSGRDDYAIALESVKEGAQDYIGKSELTEQLVVSSLAYAIERKLTETRLREGYTELAHAAQSDHLTGLLNRRAFNEQLEKLWERRGNSGGDVSCVMLDIDFFKHVNDTYGHSTGDEALVAIAGLILYGVRNGDLACRYGGEEFCIVLPGCSEQGAQQWAERLRLSVRDKRIKTKRTELSVTVSLGVAQANGQQETFEKLVDRADQALLMAKQRGRNLVVTHSRMKSISKQAAGQANQPSILDGSIRQVISQVECLAQTTPLAEAAETMLAERASLLPVIDHEGYLVGAVTERELLDVETLDQQWETPISKIMDCSIVGFEETATLASVRSFMSRTLASQVLIVKERMPVGIVHRTDLLREQYKVASTTYHSACDSSACDSANADANLQSVR